MHSSRTCLATALAICALLPGLPATSAESSPARDKKPVQSATYPKPDSQIIDEHKQIYDVSCIPMSIELVLKLTKHAPVTYYDLQNDWQNKSDGNFRNFNGKTIRGVTFRQQFSLPRDGKFPLKDLFATIDRELEAGRYVIISLASNSGWHMYVIYKKEADGDFVAVSKAGAETIEAKQVKTIVRKMKGTDILTYQLATQGSQPQ